MHTEHSRQDVRPAMGVAWVTGASRGIGRAVAVAFGRARWRVAVQYRERATEAERTVGMISDAGGEACAYQADVQDGGQMAKTASAVMERWHRLDAVVCSAGIARSHLVLRTTPEEWAQVVRTNLTGAFHTLRAAAGPMLTHGGGHIVVVGSFAGFHGQAGQAAYAASKAGLLGLVRSAAREWGGANIRVNLVLPGWHRTELADDAMPTEDVSDHVLGRTPGLDEVARSIVQLAFSRDVSGQVWNLDSRPLP